MKSEVKIPCGCRSSLTCSFWNPFKYSTVNGVFVPGAPTRVRAINARFHAQAAERAGISFTHCRKLRLYLRKCTRKRAREYTRAYASVHELCDRSTDPRSTVYIPIWNAETRIRVDMCHARGLHTRWRRAQLQWIFQFHVVFWFAHRRFRPSVDIIPSREPSLGRDPVRRA